MSCTSARHQGRNPQAFLEKHCFVLYYNMKKEDEEEEKEGLRHLKILCNSVYVYIVLQIARYLLVHLILNIFLLNNYIMWLQVE